MIKLLTALLKHPKEFRLVLSWLPSLVRGICFARRLPQPIAVEQVRGVVPTNPLERYFSAHQKGRGIWKWEHYFDIYHNHLSRFVGKEVHVVEIGIYSGGSLEMWRSYFGEQCQVYGVDIEAACRAYENEHTTIFIGDQSSPKFWEAFRKKVPRVDVLIDDGGHHTFQQVATFESMFSHINPGGVYICEDIHGEHNHFAAYMSGLSSFMNEFAMGRDGEVKTSSMQAQVRSVHQYPYATVIEKHSFPVSRLRAPRQGDCWQPFFDQPTNQV